MYACEHIDAVVLYLESIWDADDLGRLSNPIPDDVFYSILHDAAHRWSAQWAALCFLGTLLEFERERNALIQGQLPEARGIH